VIVTATSLPGRFVPDVGEQGLDKVVHAFLYGVLAFLLARSMNNPPRTTLIRVAFASIVFCMAMGSLDEWHQQFIEGRDADVNDFIADCAGSAVGASIWALKARVRTTHQS
jgi:VanZ family protein